MVTPFDTFAPLRNDLLLRAARLQSTDRVPCWALRQGLIDFQNVHEGKSFWEVCCDPDLASDCTVLPVRKFGFDAAILFTDVLFPLQAFRLRVGMDPRAGVKVFNPIDAPRDIQSLPSPSLLPCVNPVLETITLSRRKLCGDVPLIGLLGGPFTLFCYMIEGRGNRVLKKAKRWIYRYPTSCHFLLQKLTEVVIDFALLQLNAGAQAIQVMDYYLGELSPHLHELFGFAYLRQISRKLKDSFPDVPLILYTKNTFCSLDVMSRTGFNVLSVDWSVEPKAALQMVGDRVALQGNLDPCVLFAGPEGIQKEVFRMLDNFGSKGFIANLGQGLHPEVDPDSVLVFVDSVRKWSLNQTDIPATTPTSPGPLQSSIVVSKVPVEEDDYLSDEGKFDSCQFSYAVMPTSRAAANQAREWVPDEAVSVCAGCQAPFTLLLRRHHCRKCGLIFCHTCSSNKVALSFLDPPSRVCDRCFSTLSMVA